MQTDPGAKTKNNKSEDTIEEYLRKPIPARTREKIRYETNAYNLYVYVFGINYDWSKKHKSTILHIDGVLNDETWTPVHIQLGSFKPHFYLEFPKYHMDGAEFTEKNKKDFLESLDSILKERLSEAKQKSATGKLTNTLLNINYQIQNQNEKKRKRNEYEEDRDEKRVDFNPDYSIKHNTMIDQYGDEMETNGLFNEEENIEYETYLDAQEKYQSTMRNNIDASDDDQENDYKTLVRDQKLPLVLSYKLTKIMPLLYYQPEPNDVYDITVAHPKLVKELRETIHEMCPMIKLYDVTTDFVIRYLADNQIQPSSWFRLTKGTYNRIKEKDWEKYNNARFPEFYVPDYRNFVHVATTLTAKHFELTLDNHEKQEIAKETPPMKIEDYFKTKIVKYLASLIPDFTILCYDIECKTNETRFPDPAKDPIIFIAFQVYGLFGQKLEGGVKEFEISLGSVDKNPIDPNETDEDRRKKPVSKTFCVDNEKDLLIMFRHFIMEVDPDIITHHNGNGFDFKYLFARADYYKMKDFKYLGRASKQAAYRHESESKGWKKATVNIPGRMNVDLLAVARDYIPAFLECKLGYLARVLLGDDKEDLLPSLIGKYHKTKEGRTIIRNYGKKDVKLTRQVADVLKANLDPIEFSFSTALPFQTCLDRALGAKMEAKLYQEMNSKNREYKYAFEFNPRYLQNKRRKYVEMLDRMEKEEFEKNFASTTFVLDTNNNNSEEGAIIEQTTTLLLAQDEKAIQKISKTFGAPNTWRKGLNIEYDADDDNFPSLSTTPIANSKETDSSSASPPSDNVTHEIIDNTNNNNTKKSSTKPSPLFAPISKNDNSSGSADLKKAQKKETKKDDKLEEDPDEQEGFQGAAVLKTVGGLFGFINYDWVRRNWDPEKGYLHYPFSHPVATLDFSGMYPSNIMACNLCYSTLLREHDIPKYKLVEGVDYWRRPDWIEDEVTKTVKEVYNKKNPAFVTKKIRHGLLPQTEEKLGVDRGVSKADKKEQDLANIATVKKLRQYWPEDMLKNVKGLDFKWFSQNLVYITIPKDSKITESEVRAIVRKLFDDETVAIVYDRRQDKKKLIMNGMYGLTGDPTSKFYCKPIAETTTAKGRSMIHTIRFASMTEFCKDRGYPYNSSIIGGDTDSIFVHMDGLGFEFVARDKISKEDEKYIKEEAVSLTDLPGKPVLFLKKAFNYGEEMASTITKRFEKPQKLEFEKIVTDMNNIKQKNYAGLKWMIDANEPKAKFFTKGLGCKKRGECDHVKDTGMTSLDLVCVKSKIQRALDYALQRVTMLVEGDVPITQLQIVQKLSKKPEDYTTNPPAVVVAKARMLKDKTDKIDAGEIVKYVLVDYNLVNRTIKKSVKRSEQAMDPWDVMMEDIPIDIQSYKEKLEAQFFRLLHYPIRRLLEGDDFKEERRAMGIEGYQYPKLEFSKENDPIIKKAVMGFIYRNNSNYATDIIIKPKISAKEQEDKRSILSFTSNQYCVGCCKLVRAVAQRGPPVCNNCKPHIDELRNKLVAERSSLADTSTEIWKKCKSCTQGSIEDAEHCTNMSCNTRGERHLVTKKMMNTGERLVKFYMY